jgi:transmembrane sensor
VKNNPGLFVFYLGGATADACYGVWTTTAGITLSSDVDKTDGALEEAMDWLIRLQESRDDPRAREDFDAWLSGSSERVAAWRQAQRTWRLLGEVPPAHESEWRALAGFVADQNQRRRPGERGLRQFGAARRRWVVGLAAAGVAACLAVLMVPALLLRMQSDYATTTAESRIVMLDDGTTVQLAPDSAIKLDFSLERRQVKLLAGEAFFDVARNPVRPFIVDADGVKVKVLGTAFDVRLSSSDARVELARGMVDVSYDGKAGQAPQTLKPGQMLLVNRNSGAMEKGEIAVDDVASWRDGRIFVNEASVASVVEQIQRYHHAWIAIPDRTLAAQTVTGLYDLSDPDRALRALVQPYGGHVRAVSRFARVLSRF